jgi:hypothetical protein
MKKLMSEEHDPNWKKYLEKPGMTFYLKEETQGSFKFKVDCELDTSVENMYQLISKVESSKLSDIVHKGKDTILMKWT